MTVKVARKALGVGEATTYSYTLPKKTAGSCTASVDDSGVLALDAPNGRVTALAPGVGTLTVKASNGLTRSVKVQVLAAPKAIVLKKHTANLASGEKLQLDYSLTGGGKTLVSFETSSPGVATVDEVTGEVTGVSAGTAIITVRTLSGLMDSWLVNVDLEAGQSDVNGDFEITFMNIGRNDGILDP